MKRFHVHVAVVDVEQATPFYSNLFGMEPAVQKADYVKWMLNDPRINFAISSRGRAPGLDHLGIQAETSEELQEVTTRLKSANLEVLDEGSTTCCYANSEKAWVMDPAGLAWETFLTTGATTVYGDDNAVSNSEIPLAEKSACCVPEMQTVQIETRRK